MKQSILVILIAIILVGGGAFVWLQNAKKSEKAAPTNNNVKTTNTQNNPGATQKSGTTTKTGKITNNAGTFYLQEAGQSPKEVDSYSVDLQKYVGQTVTVSGQYSGDTLFIGSIEKK